MLRSVAAAADRNVDVRVDHWADILEWSQWNPTELIEEDERERALQKSVSYQYGHRKLPTAFSCINHILKTFT